MSLAASNSGHVNCCDLAMAPTIPRRTQTVLLAFIVCLAHGQSANKAHTFDVASMKPARPVPSGPILITKTGRRGRGAFGSRGCPGTGDLVDFNGKALTAEETQ